MIFKPDLAQKVMAGEKTVTRRMLSDNPRSPWWREKCRYRVGQVVAVNPGRGVTNIGHVRLTSVENVKLGFLDDSEAEREGFANLRDFEDVWTSMHGSYDPELRLWRLEFHVAAVGVPQ